MRPTFIFLLLSVCFSSIAQGSIITINVFDSTSKYPSEHFDRSSYNKVQLDSLNISYVAELYGRFEGPQEWYMLNIRSNQLSSIIDSGETYISGTNELINVDFSFQSIDGLFKNGFDYNGYILIEKINNKNIQITIDIQIIDRNKNRIYLIKKSEKTRLYKKRKM